MANNTGNKMDFEQSLSRLTEISASMNDATLPLEESVKLYGEAVGLIDICKRRIESAKLEVEKITSKSNSDNSNVQ
ncbi:MAG: exodeoxyribonuclease VII small subunit [Oscillospiraceae bacterium]|nr:exodeoxyribonuclease VII small subunit [Oscillospiraceae bacterium]